MAVVFLMVEADPRGTTHVSTHRRAPALRDPHSCPSSALRRRRAAWLRPQPRPVLACPRLPPGGLALSGDIPHSQHKPGPCAEVGMEGDRALGIGMRHGHGIDSCPLDGSQAARQRRPVCSPGSAGPWPSHHLPCRAAKTECMASAGVLLSPTLSPCGGCAMGLWGPAKMGLSASRHPRGLGHGSASAGTEWPGRVTSSPSCWREGGRPRLHLCWRGCHRPSPGS